MTIGQLRALLEQLPDDYTVTTQGCDCDGDVMSLVVEADRRNVYLRRDSKDSGRRDVFAAGDLVLHPSADGLEPFA